MKFSVDGINCYKCVVSPTKAEWNEYNNNCDAFDDGIDNFHRNCKGQDYCITASVKLKYKSEASYPHYHSIYQSVRHGCGK